MKTWVRSQSILLLMSLVFVITGCLEQSGSVGGTNYVTQPSESMSPPFTTPERTICDPFHTNSTTARDRGMVATLSWLDKTMPPGNGSRPLESVIDYFNIGHILPSLIYLDRIFVPTRNFDLNELVSQAGDNVAQDDGDPAYQYFAIRVKGQLQLATNENSGTYQLAILSDDGAILRTITPNGEEDIIADLDKSKSTRLTCSSQNLTLAENQTIPFYLDYYHGSKYQMNAVLMWRPVPDGSDPDIPVEDPMCGKAGQGLFFEPGKIPAVPRKAFYEMLARGWKVLENENFKFPEQASNPCAPVEEPLVITGFQIKSVTRNTVTLQWKTNIDSTSQVEVLNVAGNSISIFNGDSAFKKEHQLTVTGLSANTLYSFKAISVSAGGQKAISDPRAIRTLR